MNYNSATILSTVVILLIILLIFQYNSTNRDHTNAMYLINLDRRQDRLKTTGRLLNEMGYKNTIRYPAIDGSKLTDNELNNLVDPMAIKPIIQGQRTQHHHLSRGAVGCYLSHVGVWDKLDSNNIDNIIVFEDDTKPSLTKTQLDYILKKCPTDWDIILFGGQFSIDNSFNNTDFNKINKFYCLHAYMINKQAITKIRPHLFPIRMQIDSALSDIIKLENLNVYAIRNSKWYQNIDVGNTDIQTPIILDK